MFGCSIIKNGYFTTNTSNKTNYLLLPFFRTKTSRRGRSKMSKDVSVKKRPLGSSFSRAKHVYTVFRRWSALKCIRLCPLKTLEKTINNSCYLAVVLSYY